MRFGSQSKYFAAKRF